LGLRERFELTAAEKRERLRNGYRDTLEGLPEEIRRDWRVRFIAAIAALLFSRGEAYRMVLHGSLAEIVKRDLVQFCYAARSTYTPGSQAQTLRNEGRRQVWLRVRWYLDIDEKTVSELNEEDGF
jgi:hypothetical protein